MRFWRSIKNHLLPWRGNAHRPRILRKQWLVAFLGLALLSEAAIVGPALFNTAPNVLLSAVVQSDVIRFTDEARAEEGGAALKENETLDAAAQLKADDMAAKGYFSHVGPDGAQPWTWLDKAGYDYVYAGENLAVRFDDSKDVVDAWMASPTHRANIVKPQYAEIGVGIAQGEYKGAPATFVVQYFASPSFAKQAQVKAGEFEQASAASAPIAQAEPQGTAVAKAPSEAQEPVSSPAQAPVQPSVAGAETPDQGASIAAPVPAPKPSFMQSVMRSLAKAFGDSRSAATWTLSGLAMLLAAVLALTFFVRIQVQPTDLLVPGIAVALIAVTLLGVNAKYLPASATQSASVAQAHGDVGDAASTQRVVIVSP